MGKISFLSHRTELSFELILLMLLSKPWLMNINAASKWNYCPCLLNFHNLAEGVNDRTFKNFWQFSLKNSTVLNLSGMFTANFFFFLNEPKVCCSSALSFPTIKLSWCKMLLYKFYKVNPNWLYHQSVSICLSLNYYVQTQWVSITNDNLFCILQFRQERTDSHIKITMRNYVIFK